MQLSVRATGLATLLDQMPPDLACLSLACFDTLLWRNLHQPGDLFADLGIAGGPKLRSLAERRARTIAHYAEDSGEVTLDAIYAAMLPPDTDPALRAAAIAAELAVEAEHGFGFAPVRDLMLAAKARGLQIILVSDTPYQETELRALLAATVGEEVLGLIDHIFCSSAYGVGKAGGLFTHVLVELGLSPSTILHVGDHPVADRDAPARLGMHSAHLVRFDADSAQRLRLEAAVTTLIDPATGWSKPVHQPHRAAVALRDADDPAWVLGHDVLGPLLHSLAGWLHEQAEAMAARTGKPPRLLFLPDSQLPAQAFLARYPDWADRVIPVEISRFTAQAAGFHDDAAIAEYLYPNLPRLHPAQLARQLGFSPEEIGRLPPIIAPKDFRDAVMQPARRSKILRRSADFAERLTAHLRRQGLQEGDAAMLVALDDRDGIADLLDPVLRSALQLEIVGRYLLLSEQRRSGLDKGGLLDARRFDPRLLDGLQGDATLAALCGCARTPVIDYQPDGTPIHEPDGNGKPDALRDRVHAACVDYVAQTGKGFIRPPQSDTPETRRQAAAAALVRLRYLPNASETALLASFRPAPETAGQEQRHDLSHDLTRFAIQRFGLDLRKRDFDRGAIKLPALLLRGDEQHRIELDAVPTHDGFFAVTTPIAATGGAICLPFGRLYDIVQIGHIGFNEAHRRLQQGALTARPVFEQMEELAPGLFRTHGDSGLLRVPSPDNVPKGTPLLLTVVFRPVVVRQEEAIVQQAA